MEQLQTLEGRAQFRRFKIGRSLGKGGMAEVFLASMMGPGGYEKLVALKCMHPLQEADEQLTRQFISEARLSGSLNHHNIVQTVDFGFDGQKYYLALEYVDGITLSLLLSHCIRRKRPLPYGIIVDILRQICDGLEYAHNAVNAQGAPLNMIHRDIKPSNILINHHGLVKIADFGVAKAASNLNETVRGMVKGTVAYMSPEQATAQELDRRADLFSLGVILFAMLTLDQLYPSCDKELQGMIRVAKADYADRLSLLEPCPPAMTSVVLRLLAPDREQRYPSAAHLKRELMTIVGQLPSEDETDLSTLVSKAASVPDPASVDRSDELSNSAMTFNSLLAVLEDSDADLSLGAAIDDRLTISFSDPSSSEAADAHERPSELPSGDGATPRSDTVSYDKIDPNAETRELPSPAYLFPAASTSAPSLSPDASAVPGHLRDIEELPTELFKRPPAPRRSAQLAAMREVELSPPSSVPTSDHGASQESSPALQALSASNLEGAMDTPAPSSQAQLSGSGWLWVAGALFLAVVLFFVLGS